MMSRQIFGPMPARYMDYVQDVGTSGRHLLDLINDLLDLARIEADRFELRPTRFLIADLIGECLRAVTPQMQKKELAVELAAAEPDLVIEADERAMRQILLNLLSNAIKFTLPGGSVSLAIAMKADRLTIAVEDTGIGIGPENIADCFRPFDQVDNVLTRRFEGSGLGLAITKALIELHGGEIRLASTVGVGTEVTLHFPRARTRDNTVLTPRGNGL